MSSSDIPEFDPHRAMTSADDFDHTQLDATALADAWRCQAEVITNNGYRFEDLTSPNHVMMREHLKDYELTKDGAGVLFDSGCYTMAFFSLLKGRGRLPDAPKPRKGIAVVERQAAGFKPVRAGINYKVEGLARRYGVLTGTILNIEEHLEREIAISPRSVSRTNQILLMLIADLENQIA